MDQGYYHLIGRGNNRLSVFTIPGGYQTFKELLFEAKDEYPWKLSHYCLMPNHFHLLGQIHKGTDLPKLMQFLLHGYSRWYHKKADYVGHLWQGRYKSPLIEKESYFLECGRYIERNPVRADLVQKMEDHPWSSYRYYAFGEQNRLIDEDPYYAQLGSDPTERQHQYRDFTRLQTPYEPILTA